jgi:O-antigen/teichoic acid export membrane protein
MDATRSDGREDQVDVEKSVGRGAVLLTLSKFWFLASGFVIQALLAKVMRIGVDEVEGVRLYGVYSTATGFAAIVNAFVYQGTTQAVATFAGRSPKDAGAVRKAAFALQTLLGGGLFAAWFLAAPLIAREFHGNENLATPLRYASFITLSYAFYAVPMGLFTGRRLFTRQALVDLSYSTLKIVGIVGCAWALGGVLGKPEAGCAGFALASIGVLVASLLLSPPAPATDARVASSELFKFQAWTMALGGLIAWVTQADLQLLSAFTEGAKEIKDKLAGEYRAAQLFATIPYQAVFAITFVLFPLVSGIKEGDFATMRRYVAQTTKYAAVVATMIAACFAGAPERALRILYGVEYEVGAPVLRVLVLGYVAFSIFFILLATVTASGRPRSSVMLAATIALVQLPASYFFVSFGSLFDAGKATAVAMLAGLVATHLYHKKTWGSGVEIGRLLRTLAAGAVAGVAANVLVSNESLLGGPGVLATIGTTVVDGVVVAGLVSKIATVAVFAACAGLYVGLLFAIGVFDADDRARFVRVLGRRK